MARMWRPLSACEDARGYEPANHQLTYPPASRGRMKEFSNSALRVRGRTRVRSREQPAKPLLSYPPASRGREWNFKIPLSPRARTHAGTIQRSAEKGKRRKNSLAAGEAASRARRPAEARLRRTVRRGGRGAHARQGGGIPPTTYRGMRRASPRREDAEAARLRDDAPEERRRPCRRTRPEWPRAASVGAAAEHTAAD